MFLTTVGAKKYLAEKGINYEITNYKHFITVSIGDQRKDHNFFAKYPKAMLKHYKEGTCKKPEKLFSFSDEALENLAFILHFGYWRKANLITQIPDTFLNHFNP